MTRLSPHALHAVRRAHDYARVDLQETTASLTRARDQLTRTQLAYDEATAREAGLRAALDAHQAATHHEQERRTPCPT